MLRCFAYSVCGGIFFTLLQYIYSFKERKTNRITSCVTYILYIDNTTFIFTIKQTDLLFSNYPPPLVLPLLVPFSTSLNGRN